MQKKCAKKSRNVRAIGRLVGLGLNGEMKQELKFKLAHVGAPSPISSIRNAVRSAAIARKDERLGSELGWLNVRRSITQRQYEAGIAFAKLAERHAAAVAAANPDAESDTPKQAANGAQNERPVHTERSKQARVQYTMATGPLRRAGVLAVVIDTCVNNKLPSDLTNLRRGLDMLADWWRLPGAD